MYHVICWLLCCSHYHMMPTTIFLSLYPPLSLSCLSFNFLFYFLGVDASPLIPPLLSLSTNLFALLCWLSLFFFFFCLSTNHSFPFSLSFSPSLFLCLSPKLSARAKKKRKIQKACNISTSLVKKNFFRLFSSSPFLVFHWI